ncbi:MAG: serpin family protein [Thermovirgaceae bacterium]
MKTRCFLLVLAIVMGIGPFASMAAESKNAMDCETLVEGNNRFALDLYTSLAAEETFEGQNVFLSPYSVSSALAMTWAGSMGETAGQMEKVLRFQMGSKKTHEAFHEFDTMLETFQEEEAVELSVANSIWPQAGYPLKEDYVKLVRQNYGITVTPVDYRGNAEVARETINSWVEGETNKKITNLIGKNVLTPLTRLVLVNAIYFKGTWLHPFDAEATCKTPFHLNREETVEVPMMHQEGRFRYAEHKGMQAVELPYGKDNLSMLVLLPEEEKALEALEADLSVEELQQMSQAMELRKVRVSLPRFEITWGTHSLKGVLKSHGMKIPFEAGQADFSNMAGEPGDLNIGDVLHKAFVKVSEEGTEAAAATAVIVVTRSATSEEVAVFRADRPFLFFIRENSTGAILFMGRCMNPKIA